MHGENCIGPPVRSHKGGQVLQRMSRRVASLIVLSARQTLCSCVFLSPLGAQHGFATSRAARGRSWRVISFAPSCKAKREENISNWLLPRPLAGRGVVSRLDALRGQATVSMCIQTERHVRWISAATSPVVMRISRARRNSARMSSTVSSSTLRPRSTSTSNGSSIQITWRFFSRGRSQPFDRFEIKQPFRMLTT